MKFFWVFCELAWLGFVGVASGAILCGFGYVIYKLFEYSLFAGVLFVMFVLGVIGQTHKWMNRDRQ